MLLQCRLNTIFFQDCVKLIVCFASTVNVVSFDPCFDPLPKIKISLFLLSICTDKLKSALEQLAFYPKLPSVNETSERE